METIKIGDYIMYEDPHTGKTEGPEKVEEMLVLGNWFDKPYEVELSILADKTKSVRIVTHEYDFDGHNFRGECLLSDVISIQRPGEPVNDLTTLKDKVAKL